MKSLVDTIKKGKGAADFSATPVSVTLASAREPHIHQGISFIVKEEDGGIESEVPRAIWNFYLRQLQTLLSLFTVFYNQIDGFWFNREAVSLSKRLTTIDSIPGAVRLVDFRVDSFVSTH